MANCDFIGVKRLYTLSSLVWQTYSETRDPTLRSVVAYKRLKTMENYWTIDYERGHGSFNKVVVYQWF